VTSSPPPSKRLAYVALAAVVVFVAWALLRREPSPPPEATAPVAEAPAPPVEAPRPPTPPTPPAPPRVDATAPRETASRTVVLRGPWGARPGEFGRTTESEGNPEGPMSFAVAPDGTVAVLDGRNRRIQRFVDGRPTAEIALDGEAAQDLAWTPSGALVSLDRLGASTLTVHPADGRTATNISLRGGPITEGGAVTGVFADAQGVYVEREHREVVRIADADGHEDTARPTLWGRPTRDGAQLLRAEITDRGRGVVRVSVAARENGAMDWSTEVSVENPVLYLAMLDSDARGRVYVAVETGVVTAESVRDAATFVARLDRAGAVDATMRLPALAGGDEVFRPMCVDAEGAVYVMDPTREGVEVARYTFAP
jgi:hypothetical protein